MDPAKLSDGERANIRRLTAVGLRIVAVFWLIELPELLIELAQQLGNLFG
jgi:hypothetical protein